MVLVRIAHAADLPTPDEAIRALKDGGGGPSRESASPSRSAGGDGGPRLAASGGASRFEAGSRPMASASPVASAPPEPTMRLASYADLVALASEKRDLKMKHALEHAVRVVRFEDGRIELGFTEDAGQGLAGELSRRLEEWTGRRWMIVVARDAPAATIAEARRAARDQLVDDARSDPLVAAVLARFPGAEIVDVRASGGEPPPPVPGDVPMITDDPPFDEDD
jgi:DNA polymerase-3 subunit gamma/tau